MEFSRIGTFLGIAIVAVVLGFFIGRGSGQSSAGACDIHPRLTDQQLTAIRTNLERVRTHAFEAAQAEGQGRDGANKAAEDVAFDTFVHNLRGALSAEYARHREALDGCL